MRPAHERPKGAAVPFGLALLVLALSAPRGGYQDLAASIVRQPGVADRWREHLLASPFGTIHAATFRFPRPVGTAIPEPDGFARSASAVEGRSRPAFDRSPAFDPDRTFPVVDRARKGDRVAPVPAKSATALPADSAAPAGVQLAMLTPAAVPPVAATPLESAEPDERHSDDAPRTPFGDLSSGELAPFEPDGTIAAPEHGANAPPEAARFYLDIAPRGAFAVLEPWTPGEGPILEPSDDAPAHSQNKSARLASIDLPAPGETIAPKGEVTGPERTLKTPAERLGLDGRSRPKSEKCLADAVYFEARGESERGQMAVAQVVMNRVFSGYYPDNVCGVVYQNAHRHLACQFTFACDGIPDRVTEPDAWARAKRIARETLDGKHWLPDVGKATHYHATWVHPYWVRAMKKLDKIGVHTFYRPRKWGDGADSPIWGDRAEEKM